MPIYEYRCATCGRRSQHLFLTFSAAAAATPTCPHCGGTELRRLISRFATLKSEEARLEELADPSSLGDIDENDPRSVARWARKLGEQMGEDLPPEFDEMVERMEHGEMPDDLEGEGGKTGGEDSDVGDSAI
jgi:putative FmdB family regulatory protein